MKKRTHFISLALLCRVVILSALLLPCSTSLGAQPASDANGDTVTIPESLSSPQATMATFLAAMSNVREGRGQALETAVTTLDLGGVNPLVRGEKGAELAWILYEVIQRTRQPDVAKISTRRQGKTYVWNTYDSGRIEIAHQASVGWQFSAATVTALPRILDELLDQQKNDGESAPSADLPLNLRLRALVPANLRETRLILENWQWIGIVLIILFGLIADKLVAMALNLGVRIWRTRFAEGAFRNIDDEILRPMGLMAMALIWWAGLNLLGLPAGALVVLLVSVKFLACVSAVWGAYRLVDILGAFLNDRADMTASKLDDALVPLVTKTMKIFVTVMGVVFIADNLDVDVTSLLAGLGLGGLAFALAAKDVAGNLFGSVTVLLDQTFHVGDWVVIGEVEGTVERLGFRSTRIRTFYNSLVSVPNSTLITANVDNMGARVYRRLSCKFGIAYDTPPDRIDAFCAGIRKLVMLHPYMRKDNFHVYLNGLGNSSLEILIYVFWKTPDWGTELRERHRFLLDCLRLAQRLGVEYAFPTQTLWMRQAEATPLEPAQSPFQPVASQSDAQARGRAEAEAIVAATLGLDTVPPPVGSVGGSVDGE